MPLEAATYINQLDTANPAASDGLSQADDHMRLIKAALKNTVPNWTAAALNATQAQIDATCTQVLTGPMLAPSPGTVASPAYSGVGDPDTGFYFWGPNESRMSAGGVDIAAFRATGFDILTGNLFKAGVAVLPIQAANIGALQVGTAALAADAVTFAKMQNVAQDTVLGRATAGAGDPEALTLGTGVTVSGGVLNVAPALPRGYIDGCTLSNNGTNAIDVAAGVCRDSTNTVNITVAAMTAKDLASLWVAGSSAGVRETAAIANQTYHIWAVMKANGTGQDIFASSSAVASTALAALVVISPGYAGGYLGSLGSIMRESLAIVPFIQNGDDFMRKVPTQDSSSALSTTATSVTLKVPTGVKVRAKVSVLITDTNATNYLYVYDPALGDQAATAALFTYAMTGAVTGGFSSTVTVGAPHDVWTNTSAQVKAVANSATDTVSIVTLGWSHPRGKNS